MSRDLWQGIAKPFQRLRWSHSIYDRYTCAHHGLVRCFYIYSGYNNKVSKVGEMSFYLMQNVARPYGISPFLDPKYMYNAFVEFSKNNVINSCSIHLFCIFIWRKKIHVHVWSIRTYLEKYFKYLREVTLSHYSYYENKKFPPFH